MTIFSKLKVRLNFTAFLLLATLSVSMVCAVNYFQKRFSYTVAENMSLILLQHNLAFHSYFNEQLKPKIYDLIDAKNDPDFFDPAWMSSTYAVREIGKVFDKNIGIHYYYKEAAINARSPQNEADDLESDFIHRLNSDKSLQKTSGVKDINGQPYFYTLIRGEKMGKGCLRCHSSSDMAPGNLVKAYGTARSFNRVEGEVVSAISIHIPLAEAYGDADHFSIQLSAVLLSLLLLVFFLQNKLINRFVLDPLQNFRSQAESISNDIENLGVAIPEVFTHEMNEIATSFNKMSFRLKSVVDGLEGTIHKRTAALEESEAKYRLLFENMANSFSFHEMILDAHGNPSDYRFIEVNPAFEKQTGLSAADMIGKTVLEIMPNTEKNWIEKFGKVAANGEPISFESFSPESKCYHQIWAYCPKPGFFATVFSDITEQKSAEKERMMLESQLCQVQKMESIGSLAGGVAHDFNNKLSIILGYASMASSEPDQALQQQYLEQIRKAGEQSADLTRQLLAFARKQTIDPKVLDLNETVSGMLKMLNRLIGEDIQLSWHPAAELWKIKVDPSQIDQILANLCINARDSISKDGKIYIETENIVIGGDYCILHQYALPGDYVRLVVSDNGCGMEKEILDRVFEPFFTTKEMGKGTGLGLATVFGVVKQNNGFITVYSEPGLGATFSIYLPRHTGTAVLKQLEGEELPTPRGLETILLVEDELAILTMTSSILAKQGYSVLLANSPAEAICQVKEYVGQIHLLITDVIMPEMNGKDLANKLTSLNPQLKCLFMSGYTADSISQHGVLDLGVHFIQKPFSLQNLANTVREVLDGEI